MNVDPRDRGSTTPEERERLRRVFERGLATPVGAVLPLERATGPRGPGWQSGLWMLRARHLILIPATRRSGSAAAREPALGARRERSSLADRSARRARSAAAAPDERGIRSPQRARSASREPRAVRAAAARARPRARARRVGADWVVRTALCVEPRDGQLHVFMPPLASADDYLELVAAVEDTARALACPS